MSSNIAIELINISKKYRIRSTKHNTLREHLSSFFSREEDKEENEFWALKNINIKISKGECIGIYGPNGSGKTTILKLIANVTKPTEGQLIINGKVAPLISVSAGFHPDLNGRENILTNGTIIGMSINEIREKEDEIIKFSGLKNDFLSMPIKKYSSGMITRLGFSIAAHSSAEIILLDEILAVGDEKFQKKCISKLKELKKIKTIVVVSHNKPLMEEIVDKIYLMGQKEFISVNKD